MTTETSAAQPQLDARDLERLIALSSESPAQRIRSALGLARELLGLEFGYITEFRGDEQLIQGVSGDRISFEIAPGDGYPLDGSYCQRMIAGTIPNAVPNTAASREVRDLAMTKLSAIGAYIGVPIYLSDGKLYGTLCAVSHHAHEELGPRRRAPDGAAVEDRHRRHRAAAHGARERASARADRRFDRRARRSRGGSPGQPHHAVGRVPDDPARSDPAGVIRRDGAMGRCGALPGAAASAYAARCRARRGSNEHRAQLPPLVLPLRLAEVRRPVLDAAPVAARTANAVKDDLLLELDRIVDEQRLEMLPDVV